MTSLLNDRVRNTKWPVGWLWLAGGCSGIVLFLDTAGANPAPPEPYPIVTAVMLAVLGATLGIVLAAVCGAGVPGKAFWLLGATLGCIGSGLAIWCWDVACETFVGADVRGNLSAHETLFTTIGLAAGLLGGIVVGRWARGMNASTAVGARIGSSIGILVATGLVLWVVPPSPKLPVAVTLVAALAIGWIMVSACGSFGIAIGALYKRKQQRECLEPSLRRGAFVAIAVALLALCILPRVLAPKAGLGTEKLTLSGFPAAPDAADIARLDALSIEVVLADPPPSSLNPGEMKFEPLNSAEIQRFKWPYYRLLAEELGRHPAAFIRAAGLRRVVLVKQLQARPAAIACLIPVGGLADRALGTIYLDPNYGFDPTSPNGIATVGRHMAQHELFHLVQPKLFGTVYDDSRWLMANPPAFSYGSLGAEAYAPGNLGVTHPSQGFVNYYAMTSQEEDQAEVFAAMQLPEERRVLDEWAVKDTAIRAKMAYLQDFYGALCRTENTTRPGHLEEKLLDREEDHGGRRIIVR